MKEKILNLRSQGKTYSEIQETLGCSKSLISYHCTNDPKVSLRQRNRRYKNREFVNDYKSKLVCQTCGDNRYWVLDFHHRNPDEKEEKISKLLRTASLENVIKEIEKCDILCANCHRDLHYRLSNSL